MFIATQYVPAISFPQLINSPSHFLGPSPPSNTPIELTSVTMNQKLSIAGAQSSLPPAHPFIDLNIPSVLAPRDPTGIMTASLPNSSACNAQQRRLLLPPPSVHAPSVLSPTISSGILSAHPNKGPQPLRVNPPLSQLVEYPITHHSESVQVDDACPSWPPQSTPLNPSPANFEPQPNRRVTSPIEGDDRNSFANALAKNLNTAFVGAPPGNGSLQLNMNPPQLILQSDALAPLHDFSNLDFDLHNNDPADAMPDSESCDTSSDSDSSLDNMESDRDEPDGVRLAANAQGEGDVPATHSESYFMESDTSSSCDNSVEGPNHNKNRNKNMSTRKPIARNPQGALLS